MSSPTSIAHPGPLRVSNVSTALVADRLGVPAVVFFVMSAATPLTVVAGVITLAYAITGSLGLPLAFLLVGLLLALFGVGYVAMSRHVANAEAATVFAEESKHPRRTVPTAMYTAITIIAMLYALAAWAMSVAVGPDGIVAAAGEQSTDLIFNLAGDHLGGAFVDIGYALFLTSLLAAMIAFHNITARYGFALGRERVLPVAFGRTSRRSGSPIVASLVQSLIGFIVIVTYALAGWDPLVQLFFWAGTSGGLGVLLLITITSVAVLGFFARRPSGEPIWRRTVAPALATVALLVVVWLAMSHFGTLLGVAESHALRWGVPAGYLAVGLLGLGWGLILQRSRPDVYAGIGRGAKAVTTSGIGIPAPRNAPAVVHEEERR